MYVQGSSGRRKTRWWKGRAGTRNEKEEEEAGGRAASMRALMGTGCIGVCVWVCSRVVSIGLALNSIKLVPLAAVARVVYLYVCMSWFTCGVSWL